MSHFFQTKVKGIIRLNDKLYDANDFERENIKVHEMEFPDGSCPKDAIISEFIDVTHNYINKG
jgi:cell division cycle 14